jgi:acetamidase/formamidase
MTVHHLSEDEAIALMSVSADFGVTQVVDANWGVHGSIRNFFFVGT